MEKNTIIQIQLTPAEFEKTLDRAIERVIELNNSNKSESVLEQSPTFGKIPVQEIFSKKLLSKPTFYSHVKSGKITLYKLGGRSYVDANEFNDSFKKVKIHK